MVPLKLPGYLRWWRHRYPKQITQESHRKYTISIGKLDSSSETGYPGCTKRTTRPVLPGQKKTDPVRVFSPCPIKSYRCTALIETPFHLFFPTLSYHLASTLIECRRRSFCVESVDRLLDEFKSFASSRLPVVIFELIFTFF